MSIKLTILGCHSATPRVNAHPTAQYLEINSRHFLVDCGEGTQRQMRKYKVGFSKIDHIFISHMHGDHVLGLVGLVSTLGILNREKPLHIYGPKEIEKWVIFQLEISQSHVKFDIIFHELTSSKSELLFEDDKVKVYSIPLRHRIYTNGYLFKEKFKKRNLNIKAIEQFDEIEICDYNNLKAGKDFVLGNGDIIKNKELTFDPPKPLSYAYCSDTMYKPDICEIIKNADLLYHESTFLKEREDLAKKTKHSTAEQASIIAKEANVGKLVLGHFSNRYSDLNLFKKEAEINFNHVVLAEAGKCITID